jgi:ATP-dependent helicase/nuclease subunit B
VKPEHIQALYGQSLKLSASQVDKLADCRLSYFLRYGLRAKEQKSATVDPAEFGTYVHSVLENTARDITQKGGFKKVSLEETLQIAEKYAVDYARARFDQLDNQRLTYLFRRNSAELERIVRELWEELQNSDFSPIAFELSFGDDGQMPAICISGKKMDATLRGFVDRVDTWQDGENTYFRVVDYKTGKKDFDYCDVFNGLGLQMLLYLYALEQEGEEILGQCRLPAGVQYFPARVPLVSSDSVLTDEEADKERIKQWKRKGLVLSDENVLNAIENGEHILRLPITRRKDGSISGDLADEKQFALLKLYVFGLLGKMLDDVASGNITANPYTRGSSHNACSFCPYTSICHLETVENRRDFKTMTAQRFWEDIEKEVRNHG